MKKRILAAVLACTMLAGCDAKPTPPAEEEPEAAGAEVAYVPLDDRPDNVERVEYLADSLGYALKMPERDLYRTCLDGQPLNQNGTQSGDRGALYAWVIAQEAAGCDRYVISLDQLLSGGLVNSRAMSEMEAVPVTDPDTGKQTEWSEKDLLAQLLDVLTADENNQIWLLDSVMRLAATVGYRGGTVEDYDALREYGAQPRPELGRECAAEDVEQTYRLGADGKELASEAFGLTEEKIEIYLAARSRKLELSDAVLERVTALQADNVHVLIGIDDSSEENSIQKNEIAYLRSQLRPGDALLSGVDDLAFKAVTKLYLEESGWQGAPVSVRYYGGTEEQPACIYDYQPLTKIMEAHLAFFGLTQAADAPLQVLVLTQPADETERQAYYDALIEDLAACRKAQKPVILIDAGNNRYGTAFHDAITKRVDLGWLLSYAGFLDMAIVTGTALSHGVARYAFLRNGTETEASRRAFARTLADSVIKDFCYRNVVREDVAACVRDELGGSTNNFYQPPINIDRVTQVLTQRMDEETVGVVKNLEKSSFISSLSPYEEQGWGGVELKNYSFPWNRAFEISMDIRLGEFTAPHKKILGLLRG